MRRIRVYLLKSRDLSLASSWIFCFRFFQCWPGPLILNSRHKMQSSLHNASIKINANAVLAFAAWFYLPMHLFYAFKIMPHENEHSTFFFSFFLSFDLFISVRNQCGLVSGKPHRFLSQRIRATSSPHTVKSFECHLMVCQKSFYDDEHQVRWLLYECMCITVLGFRYGFFIAKFHTNDDDADDIKCNSKLWMDSVSR